MKIKVVFASELPECSCCGEPYCMKHHQHYADCECVGPDDAEERGFQLVEEDGILYAIKEKNERQTDTFQR